jgi:hypothetical protein
MRIQIGKNPQNSAGFSEKISNRAEQSKKASAIDGSHFYYSRIYNEEWRRQTF